MKKKFSSLNWNTWLTDNISYNQENIPTPNKSIPVPPSLDECPDIEIEEQ